MAAIPIFCLVFTCNLLIASSGRMSVDQSDTMFITDVAMIEPPVEMHVPGNIGSQSFSLGTHAQRKAMKMLRSKAKLAQIMAWTHQ